MTTVALNGLWAYIQTLNLSKRNRKWLADKLIEPETKEMDETEYIMSNPELVAAIKAGEEEIKRGNLQSIKLEDLWK